ncbi:MAG: four helix bundle protein [Ignavibacteriae bacterium]|nr:four helix bundle protein [Ignavibacteriota bacterium]
MLELNHKKLEVYKKSSELVKEIYKLTSDFPKSEVYGLTSQIRRAAISVISNLSEGASRKTDAERKRFYEIARSSLVELDSEIEISISLNYINTDIINLTKLSNEVFAMLSKMVK